MIPPIDFWCEAPDVHQWWENWKGLHKNSLDLPPLPARLIVMCTMDPRYEEGSGLDATLEAVRFAESNDIDCTVGVSHLPIATYADWFSMETWENVCERYRVLSPWMGEYVGMDVEAYQLQGTRYPRVGNLYEHHKLSDAVGVFSDMLRSYGVRVLFEQAHKDHLFEHVIRVRGAETIWADSAQKTMGYSMEDPSWEERGAQAYTTAHNRGAERYPTLNARGLTEPQAIFQVMQQSDGRMNVFWNNTMDKERDPAKTYRKCWPIPGWGDKLQDDPQIEPKNGKLGGLRQ